MSEVLVSNIGIFPLDLLDESLEKTVLYIGNKVSIATCSIHNTIAAERIVSVYVSLDGTIANGKRVQYLTLAANETKDVSAVFAQGLVADHRILMVQETGGSAEGDVNCWITYNRYTE